ncbi:uncharacterized protein LOC134642727 [Pelmatolapia mariae]|uniref:uncharacterized protein LOC134642727 n=1 Tax=Pelmatolapia mariae TaxID=158779 RepID=UPI002FE69035
MVLLTFLLILVLQCEVGLSETKHVLYLTPGNDVIMPCDNVPDTCSMVIWAYSKHESQTINMVHNGIVEKNSAQAARLSLHSNCSLSINNITAEDAGQYFCRPEGTADQDTTVYLNILTISAFPSDADPMEDGNVTLECSLFRYYTISPCEQNSMRWVDETGSVLLDRGVKNTGRTCVSLLTVKLQSGNKKRYTCQFEDNNTVKIEAHYTPVLIDSTPNKAFIIIGAVMLMLVVAIIAAVFIKYRRHAKVTEDIQTPTRPKHNEEILQGVLGQLISDEPESSITYATIDHTDQNASLRKTVKKEEAVTYSAVKTKVESDPSGFYRCTLPLTLRQLGWAPATLKRMVSASPSNPDLQMNGNITLKCSLFRLSSLPCDEISIRWVDDTGTVVLDKVRYTGRTCISLLTVKLHSDHNKRYTCQIVEENNVKMEAHYTPVFIDFRESMEQSPLSYAMWHLRMAALILMIVITILVIRYRGNKKLLEESNVRYVGDCDDGTVIYENVTKSG